MGSLICMPDDAATSAPPADARAWGHGLATVTDDGAVLDTWYPDPRLGNTPAGAEAPELLAKAARNHPRRRVHTEVVCTEITLADPPTGAADAYLRLHLLSHRLVAPHRLSVEGIFGVLENVVWTSLGPCPVAGFEEIRASLRAEGPVQVLGVDKFPKVDFPLITTLGTFTGRGRFTMRWGASWWRSRGSG